MMMTVLVFLVIIGVLLLIAVAGILLIIASRNKSNHGAPGNTPTTGTTINSQTNKGNEENIRDKES